MAKLPDVVTRGFEGGRRGRGGAPRQPRSLVDFDVQAPRARRALPGAQAAGAPIQRAANIQAASAQRAGNFLTPWANAAIKVDKRQQELAFKRMDVELSNAIREMTTGEGGLYTLQGQNAIDARPGFEAKLQDTIERISESAPDGRAAAAFQAAAAVRANRELGQASRHVLTAQNEVNKQVSASVLSAAMNDAVANPEYSRTSAGIIGAEVQDQGRRLGWPDEAIATAKDAAISDMHAAVIDNLAVSSPGRAQAYYEQHKEDIDPTAQTKIDAKLQDLVDREWSQAATDDIRARFPADPNAQLQEAYKIEDGVRRDEVANRLRQRTIDDNNIRTLEERELKKNAWNIVENELSTDNLTPEMRSLLTGAQLAQMDAYIAGKKGGPEIITDWALYYQLQRMRDQDLVEIDLYERHRGSLADTEFKELTRRQESLINGTTTDDQLKEAATTQQQITTAVGELELEDEKKGIFTRAARDRIDAAQRAKGKDLTYEERQQIIDGLTVSGEVMGGGFFGLVDPDKRRYELEDEEDIRRFRVTDVDEIPLRDRANLTSALRESGLEVSDETLLHYYNLSLQ
jgi:hypothetical protein